MRTPVRNGLCACLGRNIGCYDEIARESREGKTRANDWAVKRGCDENGGKRLLVKAFGTGKKHDRGREKKRRKTEK